MSKGYPRTRFEIVNQTQIQEIPQAISSDPASVIMAVYTSDKGSEDWELLYGLDDFCVRKGGISFTKHGQAQLTVAEELRAGAYVLGKRMVSPDATLANITIKARVVKSNGVSYLYFYTDSSTTAANINDAVEYGYGEFDISDIDYSAASIDIPIVTITAKGRGASALFVRINPEYISSKSASYCKYSFEVYEDSELLESIMFTMNPDIVIDGVSQALNPKVKAQSKQTQVHLYEDGVFALVNAIAVTATDLNISQIVNMDFINALDRKGQTQIPNLVSIAQSSIGAEDLWNGNMPEDIFNAVVDLRNPVGIPLVNGSNGAMGAAPMDNPEEYEKMLLATFDASELDAYKNALGSTTIYDLDAYKVDAIFDCNFPVSVKKAIAALCDFRGDMFFFQDLGIADVTTTQYVKTTDDGQNVTDGEGNLVYVTSKSIVYKNKDLAAIKESAASAAQSKYTALYHNYFNIYDPYTKKEITVTLPFLLASKFIAHQNNGIGRPFAGIPNKFYFTEIIDGSVNFFPVEIPSVNQKQELVDINVNYLSMYDGIPVLETMYVNDDEYSQLSFLHNVLAIQEIIKRIRTQCPRTRYTFLTGDDLEDYITDVESIINQYSTNFKSISVQYMYDELYESNNVFYAVLKVQFKNFIQEEYFKIIAIS